MVVRTQNGEVFIVGDNGPGEHAQGILWESFRLFRATGQMSWKRRTTTVDPITRQKVDGDPLDLGKIWIAIEPTDRSEEHTSELQSLMRISYAVFCLKKKNKVMTSINRTELTKNTTNRHGII